MDVSSRPSGNDISEEAHKWAALERLPTVDRLKKGLLTNSRGEVREVDVPNLGPQEKRSVVERLVGVGEEDNEKFLLKLRSRLDKVGIEIPTIEVRFQHLSVGTEAYVGSRNLPTLTNYVANVVEYILSSLHILPSRKEHISIIHDVSGIIKPRRLTLLLGPPSSGKTTLLLALANRLDSDLKVLGKVTYNGHEKDEFVYQRSAAYVSQHNLHNGEMTVRETLAFSARCQGVGSRYEMLAELLRREKAAKITPDCDIDIFMKAIAIEGDEASIIIDYILKILGLEECADTMVGDEMVRGLSGGQKKRVTTGEMLVGPAKVLLMDEISTGLDSATTFQIVKWLKNFVHILNETAVISLLQPAPETYNLFDDIILLSDGQIVYQGPREQVLDFFESMGFKCPERKGTADFLQEVTSKDQRQYWARKDEPYSFVTVKEFADAFKSFHVGQKLADELKTPFDKENCHPASLPTRKYALGNKELFKACISREFLLLKRGSTIFIVKIVLMLMMSLFSMTVFIRTKMRRDSVTNGGIYLGAMFFALSIVVFNGFTDLALTISKLPIFYKQRDLHFFPPWAYALPCWFLKTPLTIIEVSVWVFLTYYVTGYDPSIVRMFKQYLILFLASQMASALFRFIGAACRTMNIANTVGSFVSLIIFTLGGFILSKDDVKKWLVWCYWISPLMYGQNAIAVNEFLGKSWSHTLPNSTVSMGVAVLKSRGVVTEAYWYWLGSGATIGFILLFNFLFIVSLTYLNPLKETRSVRSESTNREGNGYNDEKNIPLAIRGNSLTENGEGIGRRISSPSATYRQGSDVEADCDRKRGMILPFEQHSITFDEIRYSIDMPQEMKNQGITENRLELLKGVSGAFRPGVLTALMGVSGAGKTTLMDVLAGRKTGGLVEGNIKISGYPKKQETFNRICGYCEQNDIHSPHVTVYESLVFSAWLRLSSEINSETRKVFIDEVMELVELTPLKNEIVGLPGVSGLSTEQRKRLTIAVELVANPSIIFMDEPTSGLDARAAAVVLRTVRNTVDTGRTVVCTIHQPSIDIFEAFDELLLLKQGGQEIYVGPLGHNSCHLIKYFEAIGVRKIEDGYNPAAWMLEVTSPSQQAALEIDFHEVYKKSNQYRRTKELIEELSTPPPGSRDLNFATQYSEGIFGQYMACLWKAHWSYWRNPSYTLVRFFFTVLIALLFGMMFWDLGWRRKRVQDIFNGLGTIYIAVLFIGLQNVSTIQPVLSIERLVFYKERAAGMYAAFPYAFAQISIEIPYIMVQSVVYAAIVYSMIGFEWTVAKFLWHLFFMLFTLLYFTFLGMWSIAITPNLETAAAICGVLFSIWNLFSGYIIPQSHIPSWWTWLYRIDPVAWSLHGLVVSQYGDVKETLDNGMIVKTFMRDYFNYKLDLLPVAAAVVAGLSIAFALAFVLSMKVFNFQRR